MSFLEERAADARIFVNYLLSEKTLLSLLRIRIPNHFIELREINRINGIHPLMIGGNRIITFESLQIIYRAMIIKFSHGNFGLEEIENLLLAAFFLRILYVIIKHNLKVGIFIGAICFAAAYLWYKHVLDIIRVYQNLLYETDYFKTLALDSINTVEYFKVKAQLKLNLRDQVPIGDFYKIPYYAFSKGMIRNHGYFQYRIDPISLFLASRDTLPKSVIDIYYTICNEYFPLCVSVVKTIWLQSKSMMSYTYFTRVNKKYCPYFIRWHWTMITLFMLVESPIIGIIYRTHQYIEYSLMPHLYIDEKTEYVNLYVLYQIEVGSLALQIFAVMHIAFILVCALHAACGQYFYIIFLTENVELHVGPRPKNSVYSCGYTSWQDEKEEELNRIFIKVWYGWFGRGTDKWSIATFFQNRLKELLRFIWRKIKKLIRKILKILRK